MPFGVSACFQVKFLTEQTKTLDINRRGAALSTAAPTLEGKIFAYWEDEAGNYYVNNAINCTTSASAVKLKAVWCDYLVVFMPATDTIAGTAEPLVTSMLPQPFMEGESEYLNTCPFLYLKNKESEDKHIFYCWNTKADGTGKSYSARKFAVNEKFTPTKPITILYPYWRETGPKATEPIKLTYRTNKPAEKRVPVPSSDNPPKVHVLKTLDEVHFETPRGYEFDGWQLSSGDITYEDDSGSKTITITGEKYEAGENCVMAQWTHIYQKDGVEKNAVSIETFIDAVWKPLPVTEITFDANGSGVTGETGTGNQEIYYKDETRPLPRNGFARADHTFTGWNTRPDGTGTPYGDGVAITITGDELVGQEVTLYARWKSNAKPATPTPQPTNPPPQTGDASNQSLWLALCMASVAAMAALIVMKKRRFLQR